MFCLFQVLCLVQEIRVSRGVCEERSTRVQFTSPEIWKWHAVPHGIQSEAPIQRFLMFGCQSENSAELDESCGDYKGMAAQKLH